MLNNIAAFDIHISLPAQTVFTVAGFGVTNAMLTGTLSLVIFLAIFIYTSYMVRNKRYNRFIGLMQWAFEGMVNQIGTMISDKKLARRIAPLAITLFFYVLISYWMSILPGLETVNANGVPLLRSITADLNFTFAITIISFITVQAYAMRQHGAFGNLGRYFKNPFKAGGIATFEGALELIGEISRYSALSLRLFGNCFAGEILLIITGVLTGYFAGLALPIFMGFELFIGFIQAYVFFILTVIFVSLALETHAAHDESTPEHTSLPSDHSPTDSAHKAALEG